MRASGCAFEARPVNRARVLEGREGGCRDRDRRPKGRDPRGLGSQEPGPAAKPRGSPKPDCSNGNGAATPASRPQATASARAPGWAGWDCLAAERVGDREIGLAPALAQACFTWGSANLVAIAETRRAYVAALQAADRGDIGPLMAFARS